MVQAFCRHDIVTSALLGLPDFPLHSGKSLGPPFHPVPIALRGFVGRPPIALGEVRLAAHPPTALGEEPGGALFGIRERRTEKVRITQEPRIIAMFRT